MGDAAVADSQKLTCVCSLPSVALMPSTLEFSGEIRGLCHTAGEITLHACQLKAIYMLAAGKHPKPSVLRVGKVC